MKTIPTEDYRTYKEEELIQFFDKNNIKSYRLKQIDDWIWNNRVLSFDLMKNLPKETREILKTHFTLNELKVEKIEKSIDSTIKSLVTFADKRKAEVVLIPLKNRRSTACVSSQIGCSLDCKFCATSLVKRSRNLHAYEIFEQMVFLNNQSILNYSQPLTNIVFMGMGEPLLNYSNVIKSIEKATLGKYFLFSHNKITISTSGIPRMIKKLADDGIKVNLAVSLHSAIESKRNKIMPFSKKFSLVELKLALKYWVEKINKKVTFEYIIWDGINDSKEDIDALVRYCSDIPSKVNIIQYNSIDNDQFIQARKEITELYLSTLQSKGITTTIRHSGGQDINAACGQLSRIS